MGQHASLVDLMQRRVIKLHCFCKKKYLLFLSESFSISTFEEISDVQFLFQIFQLLKLYKSFRYPNHPFSNFLAILTLKPISVVIPLSLITSKEYKVEKCD